MHSRHQPVVAWALAVVFGAVSAPALAQSQDNKPSSKPTPISWTYPVKHSANGRYLVDQNNAPFLIAGDSPQALIVNLSETDAEMYFANRKSHRFNAVWINLLCKAAEREGKKRTERKEDTA